MKRLLFPVILLFAPLAFASTNPGVPVGGLVLDSNGQPLQGASIQLVPLAEWHESWTMNLEDRVHLEPVAKVSGDAKGHFRLMAPERGMWRVIVEAPGRVPRQYDLQPLLEAANLPPVRLPVDNGLEVRVTDSWGQPVAGAHVRVTTPTPRARLHSRSEIEPLPDAWEPAARMGITGPDGRAVLPGAKGERVAVSVLVAGSPLIMVPETSSSPVKVALQSGCERVLEVVDARSKPVAGAVAQISGRAVAVSGENGLLSVSTPCGREMQLAVRTQDRRLGSVSLPAAGREPAKPMRVVLAAPAAPLTGRVVDAVSQQPVAGAFVWGDEPAAFTRTDDRGLYVVTASGTLNAASLEHMPASEAVQSTPGGLPAGPAFALMPAAVIEGQVVDREGKPVSGVKVQAFPKPVFPTGEEDAPRLALTGPRGLFRLRVSSDIPYDVMTEHGRYAPASIRVPSLEPRSSRKAVRLVVEAGCTVFGRVVDTNEQPVAGARVSLERSSGTASSRDFTAWGNGDGSTFEGVTDATGRFEIKRLPVDQFDLRAQAQGFSPMVVRGLSMQGKTGGRLDLGTVVLPPGRMIRGIVVDRQGKPVEGVTVTARPPDHLSQRTYRADRETLKTGANGRFVIPGLREGQRMEVRASKEGYVEGAATVVDLPTGGPVRIVLDTGLRITGQVVNEDGRPIANAGVQVDTVESGLRYGRSTKGRSQTDESGRFALDGLEPGKLVLTSTASGYLPGEVRVETVNGGAQAPEVRIVLVSGGVVSGRVIGPNGSPVAGADVRSVRTLRGETGSVYKVETVQTDAEGRYRLTGIEEGRRSIVASHPDFQRIVKDLSVEAGDNRLDLYLGQGFPVVGRVVDAAGRPVADVAVRLNSRGFGAGRDQMEEARSGADGSFQFLSVPSGTYGISAMKDAYAQTALQEAVQVAGAPVEGLELRLDTGTTLRGRVRGLGFEALANVEIVAVRMDGLGVDSGRRRGIVDFEGAYVIEGLAPGEWVVTGTAGNASARRSLLAEGAADASLDLEFGGGLTLSGRILRTGEPVAGLQVTVEGRGSSAQSMGSTGAQGEFRLEGLEPGIYTLAAVDSRRGVRHMEEVEVRKDRDMVIELPIRRVSGRVLNSSDSSPLQGATVTLERVGESRPMYLAGAPGVSTDSNGAFIVNDVGEGSWRAVARKDGYVSGEYRVEVSAGADEEGVRLELAPGAGLDLEVHTAAGGIPSEVTVGLLDGNNRVIHTGSYETQEGGRVRLGSAPAGSFRLYVSAPGAGTTIVDVTAPREGVQVILPTASQLVISVPDLANERGTGTLHVAGADGLPYRTMQYGGTQAQWPVHQGRAMLQSLPPGTWRVQVTAPDGRLWEGTATTTGGRTQLVLE